MTPNEERFGGCLDVYVYVYGFRFRFITPASPSSPDPNIRRVSGSGTVVGGINGGGGGVSGGVLL